MERCLDLRVRTISWNDQCMKEFLTRTLVQVKGTIERINGGPFLGSLEKLAPRIKVKPSICGGGCRVYGYTQKGPTEIWDDTRLALG